MDEDTCMVDIAKFFLEFTVDESCGKCAPCRIGTRRMLEILEKITKGQGTLEDLDTSGRTGSTSEVEFTVCARSDSSEPGTLNLCVTLEMNMLPILWIRNVRQAFVRHLLTYKIDADKCKGCTLVCTVPVRMVRSAVQ